MRLRPCVLAFLALASVSAPAVAADGFGVGAPTASAVPASEHLWQVDWLAATEPVTVPAPTTEPVSLTALFAASSDPTVAPQAAAPRPMAFEYSDAYNTRRKIHLYASFATLPLFVTQAILGQKLYDGNYSESTKSAHSAIAAGTAVLFGLNSVTGAWNLWEGRKDPTPHTKRTIHGILMLAADAGFVATGMLAPDDEHEAGEGGDRSTHRTVAYASMGVATVSYLIMLFSR
jgi:hypothetical protein